MKRKKCNQCGYIPARYICTRCGRSFCTSCMSEKDFVCNLCKMRGRYEPDRSHHNFAQNLIQRRYLFPISLAMIFSGITIIALTLPYFHFKQVDDNNENNTGNGFIYIFPLPFAIPIESTFVPYAIPIMVLIIIAIPVGVLIIISKRFFSFYKQEY
jgi:uncharacterized membrane protein